MANCLALVVPTATREMYNPNLSPSPNPNRKLNPFTRYSILAREIFNQNYALFIAAADGATFQPNPVSHVNSDHLAYFKFVGRIVGKAIADGQALDAHFTQSFYKASDGCFVCFACFPGC